MTWKLPVCTQFEELWVWWVLEIIPSIHLSKGKSVGSRIVVIEICFGGEKQIESYCHHFKFDFSDCLDSLSICLDYNSNCLEYISICIASISICIEYIKI